MIEARKTHPLRNVITAGGFEEQTAVASSQESDVHLLQSSHEEVDTHIILHTKAASRDGCERVIVSCRDTDVLVLLTHFAGQLSREMWMRACTRRYIILHNIELAPTLQENIPSYNAVRRCDAVNQLSGHGTLSESTIRSVEEFFCRIFSPCSNETKHQRRPLPYA